MTTKSHVPGKGGKGVGLDAAGIDAPVQRPTAVALTARETPAAEPKDDPLAAFFVDDIEAEGTALTSAEAFVTQEPRSARMAELLAFWMADEEYAIDIVQIQEIIKVPLVTEVPRAPRGILGIVSLRGTIVPILDLRVALHLGNQSPSNYSRVLVLRGDGDPLGLLVDRVSSVVRIEREAIEPVPRTMQREATDLLAGVGRIGERLLIVLELANLLSMTEAPNGR